MSAVRLKDEDVLTLRYTWPTGGTSAAAATITAMLWDTVSDGRNGTIYVNHRWETAEDPDGSVRYVCRCCGMVQDCPHAHMTYKDLEDGTHILLCEDCQAVIGDPLPHNWTYDAGDTEDSHVCAECGAAEQHFWKEVEGQHRHLHRAGRQNGQMQHLRHGKGRRSRSEGAHAGQSLEPHGAGALSKMLDLRRGN